MRKKIVYAFLCGSLVLTMAGTNFAGAAGSKISDSGSTQVACSFEEEQPDLVDSFSDMNSQDDDAVDLSNPGASADIEQAAFFNTATTSEINHYRNMLTTSQKKVFDKLKAQAPKMHVELAALFAKQGYKYVVDADAQYRGLFSPKNKQITMQKKNDTVIYHELGHYLAYAMGKADLTNEFISIYKSEAKKFDGDNKSYVTSNSREYFAESYRDYMTRRSNLKSKRPKTYAYLQKVITKMKKHEAINPQAQIAAGTSTNTEALSNLSQITADIKGSLADAVAGLQ